ncbi:MAG: response regulator [Candidatus Liptonbacteria bacterium]|nr:response regulator [Candidatus Liptonbacteria bacterium]
MAKILIVEDETPLRAALVDTLLNEGFEVLEAKDGEEGLTAALSQKPDMILLDLLMPKMSGIKVMEKLRADPLGKKVPIVVLTNQIPDDKVMADVIKYEPAYYLVKATLNLNEVVAKIRATLGR